MNYEYMTEAKWIQKWLKEEFNPDDLDWVNDSLESYEEFDNGPLMDVEKHFNIKYSTIEKQFHDRHQP
jgi:hypothetical protein